MNKLFELKFGSHLYGTNTDNSDLDIKSIYIPTPKEIVLNTYKKTITTNRPKKEFERNNKDDVDLEIFSLDRYMELLAQGQTMALDMLFAPEHMFSGQNHDQIWPHIRKNKDKLIHKDISPFIGYAKQQAAKYGLKGFRVAALRETLEWLKRQNPHAKLSDLSIEMVELLFECKTVMGHLEYVSKEFITIESKENNQGIQEEFLKVCGKYYSYNSKVKTMQEQIQKRVDQYGSRALKAELNEGVDWKALSHAVRVNNQGIELLLTGNVTFPRPDKELLLDIKLGRMQYNKVADIIVKGLEELKDTQLKSTLREKPDREWIDNFIYDVYSQVVRNENV